MSTKLSFAVVCSVIASVALATGDHSKGYKPDGTNVWIGATSGGSWADETNWRAESSSGYTVKELMQRHCFYDFSSLASGAKVTMDYKGGTIYTDRDLKDAKLSTHVMIYGIRFAGEKGDQWTVEATADANRVLMLNNCPYEVYGGDLLWNVPAYTGNYPYQGIKKLGDGVFRSAAGGNLWESEIRLNEGTYAVTNNAMFMQNFRLNMANGTTFAVEMDYQVAQIKSAKNAPSATTKVTVQSGRKLTIDTGFGQGASDYYGDIEGSNCTLRVQGGARHLLYCGDKTDAFSYAGLLEAYFGEFVFGTDKAPVGVQPEASVEVPGAGRIRFFKDQTLSTLGGTTAGVGGVVFSNSTLTVGTTACATSTVYNGVLEGGAFVKDGADYELTLGGANCYTGATRVKAGTLAVGRPFMRKGLAYKWSFEDASLDRLADSSPCASLPLMARAGGEGGLPNPTTGAYFLPEFVADGICGQALRFPVGSSKYRGAGVKFCGSVAADIKSNTSDQRPCGAGHPFTCSFWMRPMPGQCGVYPNFLGYGSLSTGSVGAGSYNYDGFLFGSVSDGSGRPFNTLGFYVHSDEWSVSGAAGQPGKVVQYCFNQNPSPIYDGKWHHVVGVYDGNLMKLYVDGEKKAEAERGAVSLPSTPTLTLGAYSSEQYKDGNHKYAGDLDEIQVLGVAWTDAEVAAEFAAKKPRPDTSLPAPLAHWTFDKLESDFTFKDVTGGGVDLQVTFTNTTRWAKGSQVTLEAIKYPDDRGSKCAYFPKLNDAHTGARLAFKDGVSLADKFTTGGSFTLVMRYSGALEKRWFYLGTATASASANVNTLYLGDGGCPRQQVWHPGTAGDLWLGDTGHWTGVANAYVGDPCWVSIAVSYDAPSQTIRYYRDGKCVASGVTGQNSSVSGTPRFQLKPEKLLFGGNGNDCWSTLRIDDLRFYDESLSAEQIRRISAAINYSAAGGDAAAEAAATPIPADSPVTVDAGATLAVRSGSAMALASLSGAGTVRVDDGATLSVGSLANFTGTIAGKGGLVLDNLSVPLAKAGAAEPLFAIEAGAGLVLPQTGTIAFTGDGSIYGRRWLVAKQGAYALPADFSGWTVSSPTGAYANTIVFVVKDGDLYLRTRAFGTTILLK